MNLMPHSPKPNLCWCAGLRVRLLRAVMETWALLPSSGTAMTAAAADAAAAATSSTGERPQLQGYRNSGAAHGCGPSSVAGGVGRQESIRV